MIHSLCVVIKYAVVQVYIIYENIFQNDVTSYFVSLCILASSPCYHLVNAIGCKFVFIYIVNNLPTCMVNDVVNVLNMYLFIYLTLPSNM